MDFTHTDIHFQNPHKMSGCHMVQPMHCAALKETQLPATGILHTFAVVWLKGSDTVLYSVPHRKFCPKSLEASFFFSWVLLKSFQSLIQISPSLLCCPIHPLCDTYSHTKSIYPMKCALPSCKVWSLSLFWLLFLWQSRFVFMQTNKENSNKDFYSEGKG